MKNVENGVTLPTESTQRGCMLDSSPISTFQTLQIPFLTSQTQQELFEVDLVVPNPNTKILKAMLLL